MTAKFHMAFVRIQTAPSQRVPLQGTGGKKYINIGIPRRLVSIGYCRVSIPPGIPKSSEYGLIQWNILG